MCHPARYRYVIETTRMRGHGQTKLRNWYRYRIFAGDREIMVSRWRSTRHYAEMWAVKTLRTLEDGPT
jgi:hypothetical protein